MESAKIVYNVVIIFLFLPCLLLLLGINNYLSVNSLITSRHTVAAIPGDLVLGALFPVHHAPGVKQAQFRLCGDIREQYGIQRIEAAFHTIDTINANKEILPNITLGIEIRDSCWYSPIALEQSIEFIRDAMAASDERSDSNDKSDTSSSSSSSSSASSSVSFLPESVSISHSPLFPMLNAPFTPFGRLNTSLMCPKQVKKVKNLVGVIGPASSSVTIQVQNLLQLFAIPQIGYSATSKDLSLKSHYMYFLRVVPSDELQAKVMVDLILKNNWTYISAIYTDGNYGSSLMEVFKNLAQDVGICLANTEVVTNNAEDWKFDEIVISILQTKSVKVVACFCEGMTVRGILKAIRRLNATGEFLLVGSDGWSDRYDVVEGYEVEASGGISVRIHSPYVHEFDPYYFNLHPDNNTRNPWFKEFWEFKFNCSLTAKTTKDSQPQTKATPIVPNPVNFPGNRLFNRSCSGQENLRDRYKQDTKLAFVIKAIWTMAYGLHNMQKKMCPHTSSSCPAMLPVNGSIFLHHLLNVSFTWYNETVSFNEFGDPPGRYDIMNFQKLSDNTYDYIHVGSWDSNANELVTWRPFQWPLKTLMSDEDVPKSVCSKPCEKGYAKNIQSDSVKCCWVCVPCQKNQFLRDEYHCENCPLGWWPDDNQTGCFQIEIEYIQWTETPSLVAIAIALFGIMLTFFTMVVFIKHNNTPVVKASTRELSYMILVGMYLCYITTFALIAMPTQETCFVTRVLPGFSFAVIYASLVTKTNRIARILAGSKKRIITKKPRFMSSSAQVVISIILILIETGIIGFMLFKEPADSKLDYPVLDKVILVCNTTSAGIIAPLGFDFFLIAMCTVYAIKTRNVPENFNEAKFIGFTMYTTLVIWIAFVPIYFGSDLKVLTMCLCISFSALVALFLLFFPKLYIILFKPEKNNRSFFTTAKNVRCHIGYVPTLGISRHSSHSTSEFSVDSPRNHSLEVKHHYNQHLKKESSSSEPSKSHHQPATLLTDKSTSSLLNIKPDKRRSSFNIFERFRISKQDKIAANVQQKIRAVRAAEALDRQTNRRVPGRAPPRQSSSSGMDIPEEGENSGKMRLVQLLKQAYGEDVNKIPGFTEFVESAKRESRRVLVENSAQTSYDLLETWFPALRHRIPRNGANGTSANTSTSGGPSGARSTSTTTNGEIVLMTSLDECDDRSANGFHRLLKQGSSVAPLSYRSEQAQSVHQPQQQTLWSTEKDTSLNGVNSLGASSIHHPHHLYHQQQQQQNQSQQWSTNYAVLSNQLSNVLQDGRQQLTTLRLNSKGSNLSSPSNLRKRPGSVSSSSAKVRASEESLLSGTNSCVIEESASSGGESSPSSGVVYKNIIINLGGTSDSQGENINEMSRSESLRLRQKHQHHQQ